MKPNFFIVGAPRCGTTAMYDYLKAHPEISMSSYKEPHYFGTDLQGLQFEIFRQKEAQYLQLFHDAKEGQRIGEASVYYLFSKVAAQEIHQFNPDAKIIIMLRSPLEVLHSLFYHVKLTGDIQYERYEDLLNDVEKLKDEASLNARLRFLSGEGILYSQQVQRYFEQFTAANVHIIIYDDFRQNTALEYRKTLEFLGLDTSFQPEKFELVNPAKRVRNSFLHRFTSSQTLIKLGMKIPFIAIPIYRALKVFNSKELERDAIPAAVRLRLQGLIEAEVAALSTLLNRDLSAWLSA